MQVNISFLSLCIDAYTGNAPEIGKDPLVSPGLMEGAHILSHLLILVFVHEL